MITYSKTTAEDIGLIYGFCKQLIDNYEDVATIDYDRVLKWVYRKIENAIGEYTVIYAGQKKAGYYHFYRNEDGGYEIDDLYIFPEYQNQGIGSEVIRTCCESVEAPVMLYVFVKNERAVSLYQRLGFNVIETVHSSRYIMQRDKKPFARSERNL